MKFRPNGIVTLSSDFGGLGPYEGQMRGAVLAAAPSARPVDLWHGVPPQDVEAGAFLLPRLWPSFPAGTVHVCVVDPGVGTARAALAVAWEGSLLVGPDNGLFTRALREGGEARLLDPEKLGFGELSSTFHGRDLFAPAGARLAAGDLEWEDLESPPAPPAFLDLPGFTREEGGRLRGEVVWADAFGNLVTSIPGEALPGAPEPRGFLEIGGRRLPLRRTYGEAVPGELLALIDSFGLLEAARRDGSAQAFLEAGRKTEVRYLPS